MKSKKILEDGTTDTSALLFVHDGKKTKQTLINLYTGEEEKRKEERLKEKHKKFIDYVIIEWANEIATE